MQTQASYHFYDYHPQPANFYQEIIDGLSKQQKQIPPKFLYDERGSELFTQICASPEYYPTRTEYQILHENLDEITKLVGTGCLLVEPGSGNSQKVRILLDDLRPKAYLPLDISKEYLIEASKNLLSDFPWLQVHAACIDYTANLDLPSEIPTGRRVAFFPGSSIGNFEPRDAVKFLSNVAESVGPGGGLLIGVDLKKESGPLTAAYNDAGGITAAFNKNLLTRINREIGGNFNLAKFQHYAFYNKEIGRVELHLISCDAQDVMIDNQHFHFEREESIHTENSYKYHPQEFQNLAEKAGFKSAAVWVDLNALFSVHYFQI